ncbi:MAG: hypothetical protein JNM81_13865 [Rhodospirillaceae bacterium]|nr:hypothetical protein [Rhodospirillaceae bacterium]
MSEKETSEKTARANEALANPVLQEAFALLAQSYIAGIRACAPKDDLGRYRYTVALNVIDAVQRHLKAVADTGALDAAQMREFAEPPKRWIPRF